MLLINLTDQLKSRKILNFIPYWFFPTYLKHCKQQASLDEEQLNEVDQFRWKQTELPEWLVHVVSFIAEVGPSFTQATRE